MALFDTPVIRQAALIPMPSTRMERTLARCVTCNVFIKHNMTEQIYLVNRFVANKSPLAANAPKNNCQRGNRWAIIGRDRNRQSPRSLLTIRLAVYVIEFRGLLYTLWPSCKLCPLTGRVDGSGVGRNRTDARRVQSPARRTIDSPAVTMRGPTG